ncbi:hypothetical protein DIURU_001978 [Diutina rugosa]|uniref:Uncharacterized protein n=1 Tax=Diutina rugosa TaxID=5481 RepID=A0A642URV4_DIURU|nr:uncharacterized protein DIURU_001978 [Diutina rugosa]KAA8904026.1 hypothetical protein DIURU_001978 [Diutina rugosa]
MSMSASSAEELLRKGAVEALESGDYLSYSTFVDVCLAEPNSFASVEAREQVLTTLLDVLKAHPKLVFEIGWDIPSVLLPYIDSDYDYTSKPLREAPCVPLVLKLFQELAVNGNAKELFLKSCELLTQLDCSSIEVKPGPDEIYRRAAIFDIKLYCVIELMDACTRRIKTAYPSRFLAMSASSFVNMLSKNPMDNNTHCQFVLRRCYQFVRGYEGMLPPDSEANETASEYSLDQGDQSENDSHLKSDKIEIAEEIISDAVESQIEANSKLAENDKSFPAIDLGSLTKSHVGTPLVDAAPSRDDEDYLQRKILQSFVTSAVQVALKEVVFGFTTDYISYLQREQRHKLTRYLDYELSAPVLTRLNELCQSFDISPQHTFEAMVKRAHDLIPARIDEDDGIGLLFENVIKEYQEYASVLVASDAKRVVVSERGCAILWTYEVAYPHKFDYVFTFKDAVALLFVGVIPGMVNPAYRLVGFEDACVYWIWYSLHSSNAGISLVDDSVLVVVFQVLLHIISNNDTRPNFRYGATTLLTKILALTDELIAWNFITDSLKDCPFENVKMSLTGILKELLTQDRPAAEGNGPKTPSRKYLKLNDDRGLILFEIIAEQIEQTFSVEQIGNGRVVRIVPTTYGVLATYLNLLVALNGVNLLQSDVLAKSLNHYIQVVADKLDELDNEADPLEKNAADMMRLTLNRVSEAKDKNEAPVL